jgi:hypothetical protein
VYGGRANHPCALQPRDTGNGRRRGVSGGSALSIKASIVNINRVKTFSMHPRQLSAPKVIGGLLSTLLKRNSPICRDYLGLSYPRLSQRPSTGGHQSSCALAFTSSISILLSVRVNAPSHSVHTDTTTVSADGLSLCCFCAPYLAGTAVFRARAGQQRTAVAFNRDFRCRCVCLPCWTFSLSVLNYPFLQCCFTSGYR